MAIIPFGLEIPSSEFTLTTDILFPRGEMGEALRYKLRAALSRIYADSTDPAEREMIRTLMAKTRGQRMHLTEEEAEFLSWVMSTPGPQYQLVEGEKRTAVVPKRTLIG